MHIMSYLCKTIHIDMELNSVDYARLIQSAAQKFHSVSLNKTQINKVLFYVYGVYLAEKGKPLFKDDTPKAWTYGPVFPIPNKRVDIHEIINGFPIEKVKAFKDNKDVLQLVIRAVEKMHNISALSLTKWSHIEGSPWYDTLYVKNEDGKVIEQRPWGIRISDDLIKAYFSKPENRIFGSI